MVRRLLITKDSQGKRTPVRVAKPHPALSIPCRKLGEQLTTGRCKPCKNGGITTFPVHACPLHAVCVPSGKSVIADLGEGPEEITRRCVDCADYDPQAVTAPAWPMNGRPAWEGVIEPKPWQYQVTAAIPHLDTPEELELVVELLQLQTVKPYIVIVDTGSTPENLQRVEALRSWSVEVHCLRLNAAWHASDFPAIAMDLAQSACFTPWLFCTHSDVFPMRRDLIESLLSLVQADQPRARSSNPHEDWGSLQPIDTQLPCAVGYRMTERLHKDWERMISHTCTLLHMPTMDRIGAGWSLRRLCNRHGVPELHGSRKPGNWPDTEVLLNYILWQHGLTPENGNVILLDGERNLQRTLDENIDHCRSLTCGRLYASDEYVSRANHWVSDAIRAGKERAREWGALVNASRQSQTASSAVARIRNSSR